jgi:hypothetical protein
MAENKIYYAQSVSIDEVTVYPTNGEPLLIKELVIELSYFEDLYGDTVSGYVTLRDTQAIVQRWQLLNLCKIKINFGRTSGVKENTSGDFIIYAIDKKTTGHLTEEYVKLHFCSKEFLESESSKVQRPRPEGGEEIHKYVKYILTDFLKIKDKKIDIEDTQGLYEFNIETKSPFAAINWLSIRARSASQPLAGADMLFFENKNGYNFKSLRTLRSQDTYNYYNYNVTNVGTDIERKTHDILQLEYVKSFNALEAINSGVFANQLITIDTITAQSKLINFNYLDYINNNKPSNGYGIINDATLFGKKLTENYRSVTRISATNSDSTNNKDITGKNPGSVPKDFTVENYIPHRKTQLLLSNFTLLKVSVPGDPNLTVGMTINLNIYSLTINGDTRELDKFYSGKYLINAVRHVLQPSNSMYQTYMELAKDSYSEQLESGGTN